MDKEMNDKYMKAMMHLKSLTNHIQVHGFTRVKDLKFIKDDQVNEIEFLPYTVMRGDKKAKRVFGVKINGEDTGLYSIEMDCHHITEDECIRNVIFYQMFGPDEEIKATHKEFTAEFEENKFTPPGVIAEEYMNKVRDEYYIKGV